MKFDNELIEQFKSVYHHANLPTYRITLFNERQQEQILQLIDDIYNYPQLMAQIMSIILKTIQNLNIITKQKQTYTKFLHFPGCGSSLQLSNIKIQAQSFEIKLGIIVNNKINIQESSLSSYDKSTLSFNFQQSIEDHSLIAHCQYITILQLTSGSKTLLFQLDQQQQNFVITVIFEMLHQYDFQFNIPEGINLNNWNMLELNYQEETFLLSINNVKIKQQNKQKVDFQLNNIHQIVIGSDVEFDNNLNQDQYRGVSKSFLDCSYINLNEYFSGQLCYFSISSINQNKKNHELQLLLQHAHQIWEIDQLKETILNSQFLLDNKQTNQCRLFKYNDITDDKQFNRKFSCISQNVFLLDVYGFIDIFKQNGGLNLIYGCLDMLNYIINQIHLNRPNYLQKEEKVLSNLIINSFEIIYEVLKNDQQSLEQFLNQGYLFVELIMNKQQFYSREFNDNITDHFVTLLLKGKMLNMNKHNNKLQLSEVVNIIQDSSSQLGIQSLNYILEQYKLNLKEYVQFEILDLFIKLFKIQLVSNILKDHISAYLSELLKKSLFKNINQQNTNYFSSIIKYPDLGTFLFYLIPSQLEKSLFKKSISEKQIEQQALNPRMKSFEILTYLFTYLIEQTQCTQFKLWELHSHFLTKESLQIFLEVTYNQVIQYMAVYGMYEMNGEFKINDNIQLIKTENLIFALLHIEKCVSEINSDHIRFDFFWKLLDKFMILFHQLGILFQYQPQDMANVRVSEQWKIDIDERRVFLNGGIRRIILQLIGQFICQVGSYQVIFNYFQLSKKQQQINNNKMNGDQLFKQMLPNLIDENNIILQEVNKIKNANKKFTNIWKFEIAYLVYRIIECQEFEEMNENQQKNLNQVIEVILKLQQIPKIEQLLYDLNDFKEYDTDFQFEIYDLNKLVLEYSRSTRDITKKMNAISSRSKSGQFYQGDQSYKLPTIKDLLEYNVHYTQKENIRKIIYHTSYKQFEFIHQVWLKLHQSSLSDSNSLNQINFDQGQCSLQSVKSATSSENRVRQQSKSKIQEKWEKLLFELKSKNSFFYYLQEDLEQLYLELNKFLKDQEFNFEIFDKIKNKYKVSSLEDGIRRRQQLIQIRASESKKPYILGTQKVTAISSKKKLQQIDSSLEKSPVLSGKSPLDQFQDDETSLSQSLSSLKKSRKSQQSLGLIQPELVIAPSFSGIRLRKGSDMSSKLVETQMYSFPCEYIQQEGGIMGELLIIVNKEKAKLKFRSTEVKHNYIITCQEKVQLNAEIQFSVDISEIKYIFTRRFMMIEVAIEIFYEQSTQFFNFFEENKRKSVLDKLKQLKIPCIVNRIEEFKKKDFTTKWKQGFISNFEYLMLINTYSGRTYNDLTQYFVFPWIIKEFRSHSLHLNSLSQYSTFRDLSSPVGAQDEHRLKQLLERYQQRNKSNPDEEMLYGSHYSNSTIVVNYLLRLEPFNEFHFKLQKNKFDIPDRLFSSIETMWENSKNQDQKELIPEFYYMPEFLQNINDFDFGQTQSHVRVQNVFLPYWVKTKTAEEFVYIMRQALESRYVSKYINLWIDLIFGYKQQGKYAEQSNNLFHYLTYESNVVQKYYRQDPDFVSYLAQIYYCGQTPFQLFKNPHEQKYVYYNFYNVEKPIFASKGLLYEHKDQITIIFSFLFEKQVFLITNKFVLIKLQTPNYLNFLLAQNQQYQYVDQISLGKVDDDQCNPLSLFTFIYQRSDNFIDKVDSQSHYLVDTKLTSLYIAVGGFNDSSFSILNLQNKSSQSSTQSYIKHTKKVSCIKYHCQTQMLAVGSFDCTISLYKLNFQNPENLIENPFKYIKSHRAPITCLDMSDTYILSVDNYFHSYVHAIKGSLTKDKFESKVGQLLHHIVLVNDFQIYQCLIHPAQFFIFKGKRGQLHFYTFNAIPYLVNFDLSQEETQNIVFLTPFSQYFFLFNTKSSNLTCIGIFELKLIQQSYPTKQQFKQDLNNLSDQKQKKSKKKMQGISSVQIILEPESLEMKSSIEEVYFITSENSFYWLKQSKQSQNDFLVKHLDFAGLLVTN